MGDGVLLFCVVFFGWGNSCMVSTIKAGNTLDSILNSVAYCSLRVGGGLHVGDFCKGSRKVATCLALPTGARVGSVCHQT